jgi:hypothetical protein
VNAGRDTSETELTPGGSATEAVHIARPKRPNTSARDTRDLDGDDPAPRRSERRDRIREAKEQERGGKALRYAGGEVRSTRSECTKVKPAFLTNGSTRGRPRTPCPSIRHRHIALASDRTHVHRRRCVYRREETDRDTPSDRPCDAEADDTTVGCSLYRMARSKCVFYTGREHRRSRVLTTAA